MLCNMLQLPGGTFIDMENISNFSVKEVANNVYATYAESVTGGTFLFSDGWPSMDSAIACLASFLGNLCPNFNWSLPPMPSTLGSFCNFATDLVPSEVKDAVDGVKSLGFSESTAIGKINGGLGGSGVASSAISSLANSDALNAISDASNASSSFTGTGNGLPNAIWDTTKGDAGLASKVNNSSKSIADSSSDAWKKSKDLIDNMTSNSPFEKLDAWL